MGAACWPLNGAGDGPSDPLGLGMTMMKRSARISECGLYRYSLTRAWGMDGEALAFVMLNPSTADADLDDPTIRRCMSFARREGYARLMVLNLYAFQATNPKALLACEDPVGPLNNEYLAMVLSERVRRGLPTVAAWGVNAQLDRVRAVLNLQPDADWRCLGTTKAGHPRHPLYVKGDQPLRPLTPVNKQV